MKKILLSLIGILTSVTILAEEPEVVYEVLQVRGSIPVEGLTYQYGVVHHETGPDTYEATLTDGTSISTPKVDFIKTSITIAGDPNTYTVTTIGVGAFSPRGDNNKYLGNSSISHVVIPESITKIEANTFNNCSNIRFVEFLSPTIPSVSNKNAFSGCSNLDFVYCKSNNANSSLPTFLPDNKMMSLFIPYGSLDGYTTSDYSVAWKNKFGDRIYGVDTERGMEIVTCSDNTSDAKGMTFVCATGEGKEATLYIGKDSPEIRVPSTFKNGNDTYNVVAIGRPAFYNCSTIERLWLPSSLTDISTSAFSGCSKLVFIDLQQTNHTKFSPSIFPKNELMTLFVPDESKGKYLASEWATQYGDRIYGGSMKSNTYQEMDFIYADGNEKVAILVKGKNAATAEVSYLSGYSIKGIGRSAFLDCKDLTSIIIPNSVTTISNMAFQGCSNLQSLALSDKLKSIGSSAFSGCSSLKELILPSVETIGSSAFNGCSGLQKLDIPSNLKTIYSNAFSGCSNIAHIRCRASASLDAKNLPNNEMMTLYVNEGTKTQYTGAEWNRFGERVYEGEMMPLTDDDGMEYIYASITREATLLKGKAAEEDVVVKANVQEHPVKSIDKGAFSGFSSIITLEIEEGITGIGPNAFYNCKGLKSVKLPKSLKTIKSNAFNGCSSLANVFCDVISPFSINDNVFSTARNLYVPKNSVDDYKNTDGWKKFSVIMGGQPKEIVYDGSTYVCATGSLEAVLIKGDNKTTVIIPSSVPDDKDSSISYQLIAIDNGAFSDRTSLDKLTFEDGENSISIGEKAFSGCSNLRILTLPSKLDKIGSQAFSSCNKLEYIICKSTSPSAIDQVFSTSIGTLYVPTGYKNAYATCGGWSNISNVVECDGMQVDTKDGLTYTFLKQGELKTATIIKGVSPISPAEGVLNLPNTVSVTEGDSYNVVAIANSAFSGNSNIKEVRLSDNITSIGNFAFNSCSNLNKITFSSQKKLKSIGESSFAGTSITSAAIPDSVKTIGANAFSKCYKLESIVFPSSLTFIGDNAFADCSKISTIISNIRGDNLETLCSDIRLVFTASISPTIYVPTGLKTIYETAWASKFDSGNFIAASTGTGQDSNGWNYEYLDYGEGTRIATLINALKDKGVTHLFIPDTVRINGTTYVVTEIAESAFKDYPNKANVDKLTIPENIQKIGANAFSGFSSLQRLWLSSTLTFIGANAFNGCKGITHISSKNDSPIAINNNVFSSYGATLFVPHKDKYKIGGWDNFLTVVEGYLVDVPTYDGMTFDCVQKGDSVSVATLTKSSTTGSVVNVPPTVKVGDVSFKVTTISANAFSGNSSVEELTIPDSIRTIGVSAFQNCSKLKKVWLPKSLTSIGSKAFNGCNNLTRVCIKTYPSIENTDAFSTYSKAMLFVPAGTLSDIDSKSGWRDFTRRYEGYYVDESPESVDRIFIYLKHSENNRTAILYKSKTSDPIKSSIKYDGKSYDVTIIGESAFSGVTLGSLELPNTIIEIEKNAFQGQKNLTRLTLPSSLKIIGNNAFSGNSKLESLTFSDKVESIGDNAFNGCVNLKKLVLPASLKSIGYGAFSGNTNLNDLTISEGIEMIGDNAFKDCSILENIVLPSSLKTIGSTAFDGCNNLTEIISKITDETVIKNNALSMPYAILYVPNHKDWYDGWNCMHILEGDKQLSDEMDGLKYACSTGDKKAVLINATKTGDVTIPGSIKIGDDDYEVIAIDKAVFKGNTDIKSVVMGDNIQTIGANAFQGCSNLKMIEIPATIKSIGVDALDGCTSLTEVICKSVDNKFITENVLSQPNATLYVTDHKDWYKNAGWNFAHIYQGERMTKVIDGLEYAYPAGSGEAILIGISETAEWKDGKVIIPESISVGKPAVDYKVINIADNVFKDNTAIKTVEIGKNVQSIGANAFEGCKNLKEIVSKITDASVISGITFSLPNAMLYVPDANLVDIYKQNWSFAEYFVGNRLTTEIDGMSYVCATGDKKAVLVSGITEKLGENITIPGSITPEGETEKYTVIGIAENAFSGNTNIVSVMIDEKVKTIGANAFQGCSKLSMVWLPSTLESIAEKAFDGCDDIAYISTKSKTPLVSPNINSNVFSKYKATLYVPDGTLAGYSASEVWKTFPIRREGYFKGVKKENGLTYECLINGEGETAKTVAILIKSETTDKIVEIQPSVKLDGDAATSYNVTVISKEAFSGNNSKNNLEKLILPATLKKIEDEAFKICTKLSIITSRITKNNLFTFNENVFSQTVYDNATVYVPYDEDGSTMTKYTQTLGWSYFSSSNYAQGEKNTYIDDASGMTYDYITGVGTATLTNAATDNDKVVVDGKVKIGSDTYTVTAIGPNAFKNCKNLKKLWLPASLTEIGKQAFSGCKSLTRVSTKSLPEITDDVFPVSIPYLFIPDGKSVNSMTGWNSFTKVIEGHYVGDVTLGDISYICIENGSAAEKTSMLIKAPKAATTFASSVVFEKETYALTTIGEAAFESNTAFVNLVIPEGVKTIEANAFKNSSKLHSVELPSTLKKVGDNAFEGCSLAFLQSLIEKPNAISDNVFADEVFNNATLYIPEKASGKYSSAGGWKNFKTVVEGIATEVTIEDMTYICVDSSEKRVAKLTKGLSKAKEVKVPAKLFTDDVNYQVVEIDKSAFEGNSSLEKVIVSEGIKTIGLSAFKQCSNLKSLVLPASLETVGDYAFDNCLRLATVTCAGEKPVDISDNVFSVTTLEVNVSSRSAVKAYKDHKVWGSFDIYYSMSSSGETGTEETDVATYQIVSSEEDDETTVAIVDDDNVTGNFSIPASVERNGVVIPVTMIAPSAFEDNTELTSVSLPATITSIGEGAFAGCEKLQSITVNNPEPVALSSTPAAVRGIRTRAGERSVFEGVNMDTCILYVPEGSVDKYKAADVWKDFKNIQAISATGVAGVIMDGTPFDVYNLQGQKVKSGVTTLKGLTPGVYIVKGKKVVLK